MGLYFLAKIRNNYELRNTNDEIRCEPHGRGMKKDYEGVSWRCSEGLGGGGELIIDKKRVGEMCVARIGNDERQITNDE